MTLRPLSSSRRKLLERSTARYQSQLDSDARAYLEGRGLSPAIETHRFGVVRSPLREHEQYVGRLVIPYLGPKGNVYALRFRCLRDHDHNQVGCSKYLGEAGQPTRMYNTPALLAPTRSLIVTEGELDAATVDLCGWPAIGIPGADSWHAHYPRVVAGFEHIILPIDGDEAGRKFARKVSSSVPDCRVIPLPPGEDVNSIYCRQGKQGLQELFTVQEDE